jgi:tetratricopeptide (TPR) repeat protein
MRGWRYGVAFAGALVGLGGAIYLAFYGLQGLEPQPVAPERTAAPIPQPPTPSLTTTPTIVAVEPNPPQVTVPAPPPRPPSNSNRRPAPRPVLIGTPAPRQIARDSAWRFTQRGRDSAALAVLDRWLVDHENDREVRRDVARLRLSVGDTAGAWVEYERLLRSAADDSLRAEYAAALLARGSLAEAARQYDALRRRDPNRPEWRLGAARARLWGASPREALEALGTDPAPPGSEVARLRRQARVMLDLSVAEAQEWVAEDPSDAEAHLALARALARAGRPREALSSYQRAIATAPSAALYAELAGVASAIPDSAAVAVALRHAVALDPDNLALRRRYMEALAWSGNRSAAAAELDRLLALAPPSADLLQLRGDLHRWRGDRRAARDAYRRALETDSAFAPARRGLGLVAQEARRDLPWPADEGSSLTVTGLADTDEFENLLVRGTHGMPLDFDRRAVLSAGAEVRRVSRRAPPGADRVIEGWGGDIGFGYRFDAARVSGRLGFLDFSGTERVLGWRVGAEGTLGTSAWRVGAGRMPAYETLRAGATVALPTGDTRDTALIGTSAELVVNTPIGSRAELWLRGERLGLGDGNRRTSFETALRWRLAPSFSAVYGGGLLGFADPSASYWSPSWYTLQSVGVEYRQRWPTGLLLAAQIRPGVAWTRESPPPGFATVSSSQLLWQLGGEAEYQRERYALAGRFGWGRDRGGRYASWFWGLGARYRW